MILGGSLGGVIELAHGEDSLVATAANAATVLGGTENDTFSFTGAVRDFSLVGGFGADSLTATGQLRGSTIWGGSPLAAGSPIDGADYVSVGSASASAATATAVPTACSSAAVRRLRRFMAVWITTWSASAAI